MPVHVVKQGECMNSIADQHGFFWQTLWNHERNAELKDRRQNPNVLMAGDRVFIPDIRQKEESGETTKVHKFQLKGVPVKLNVQLLDIGGIVRTNIQYTLTVDGKKTTGVAGSDGMVSEVIPPRARRAHLSLETGEEYDLDLGYMNPVEYTSGVQARLKNLGYYKGDISGTLDDETRKAIRKFQRDKQLPETGEPDQATRDALRGEHQG
jgi:Putative peptidoglycan binding domain